MAGQGGAQGGAGAARRTEAVKHPLLARREELRRELRRVEQEIAAAARAAARAKGLLYCPSGHEARMLEEAK